MNKKTFLGLTLIALGYFALQLAVVLWVAL